MVVRTKVKDEPNLLQATDGQQVFLFPRETLNQIKAKARNHITSQMRLNGRDALAFVEETTQSDISDDAHTDDV